MYPKCPSIVGEECLKNFKVLSTTLFLLLFTVSATLVAAHSPIGTEDNESIQTAAYIPEPTKSWALYASLSSDGDAQYYTFNITAEDERIQVSLFKSTREQDADFTPRLVLMGQDVASTGGIPDEVTVPQGLNAQLIAQTEAAPTFEPFSPGTYTDLAEVTIDNLAPGQYYLAVFEESDEPAGGNYGLAVGYRETYTIQDWILIPYSLISIYQWQGQSLLLILTPMIATLAVGIVIVALNLRNNCALKNVSAWLAAIAGLTFVGTAASTTFQLAWDATIVPVGWEAILTAIFILIPLILGFLTLRVALKNSQKVTIKKRVYLVILGVAALFAWAGLIVGPVLAIVVAFMPNLNKSA